MHRQIATEGGVHWGSWANQIVTLVGHIIQSNRSDSPDFKRFARENCNHPLLLPKRVTQLWLERARISRTCLFALVCCRLKRQTKQTHRRLAPFYPHFAEILRFECGAEQFPRSAAQKHVTRVFFGQPFQT